MSNLFGLFGDKQYHGMIRFAVPVKQCKAGAAIRSIRRIDGIVVEINFVVVVTHHAYVTTLQNTHLTTTRTTTTITS